MVDVLYSFIRCGATIFYARVYRSRSTTADQEANAGAVALFFSGRRERQLESVNNGYV
jgi:hypothetical protein